jgi:hypothetical protein
LDEAQTRSALDALVPVVAAGMRRSAQTPGGLQDIFKSVLTGGFGQTLEDEDAVRFERSKPRGDDILGQIFGSKEESRELAQRLSATSGIGAAILKKLLPIVATIVMGSLANRIGVGRPGGGTGGGLGDILKDVLGGARQPAEGPPEPAPPPQRRGGSGNPLEDILGDILGGGGGDRGRVVVKQVPSDQMGEILRDIFGGGFSGGQGGAPSPRPPPEESLIRGRRTLDDILGGGTRTGNDADDLLNSVENAIRRR